MRPLLKSAGGRGLHLTGAVSDFALAAALPAFERAGVEFIPDRVGRFGFACGMNMNMVRGTREVEPGRGEPIVGPWTGGPEALPRPAGRALLGRDGIACRGRGFGGIGARPPWPAPMSSWRRRRSRIVTWTAGAAAAAVLAIGVLVGVAGHYPTSVPTPPQASVSVQPMAQVGTNRLASTVSLSSQQWGTFISMNCVCLAPLNAHHDTLAMVVVGRDGSHTRMATWVANPGHTATPAGSISTPVDQIASVQVVSADDGQVLLERSL